MNNSLINKCLDKYNFEMTLKRMINLCYYIYFMYLHLKIKLRNNGKRKVTISKKSLKLKY